jgi:hypothetical protein
MSTARTVEALPAGTRLLHIGIPKTGTTALQRAAAANREALLAHGVRYPGRTVNHREAVCALMGRRLGWRGAGEWVPDRSLWDELVAELDADPVRRALVSHEFASESTVEQARRFADSLGPSLHVVVTLRGFAHLLGSSWQQYVKAGRRRPLGRWLHDLLDDEPYKHAAQFFYQRNDQAAVVRRWIEVVGVDRVTVVIADKNQPTQLTDAFEDLLGISRGLLAADDSGFAANRSMSYPEAELVRRLNMVVRKPVISWHQYDPLVRNGGVARMLENRRPGRHEPPVGLPDWAAEKATVRAREYADAIAATGCRVVGDLATLSAPVRSLGRKLPKCDDVPIDAAVELAAGMLSAGLGRGAFFDVTDKASGPVQERLVRTEPGRRWLELGAATSTASVADLLAVAVLRMLRRLPGGTG